MVDGEPEVTEEEQERWTHEELPAQEREVNYARIKRWIIQREGKDFIQYQGLIDLLHQESGGEFSITTHLEQAPTAENGQTAIVSALVSIGPNALRCASGVGDANASNVTRMMAPHAIRMAETRAKARALRDLLNVGYVAAEELGPDGPATDRVPDRTPTSGEVETITIDGRAYTRDQVWGFYQQRAAQCRDRGLAIPQPMLNRNVPLQTIVNQTQVMKRTLAEAGALAPASAGEGRP